MESNSEEVATVTDASPESEWNPFKEANLEQTLVEQESDWADSVPPKSHNDDAGHSNEEEEWTDFVETPKLVHNNQPFLHLVENFLLKQNMNEITFCEDKTENELNVDQDSTWNELKRYTSINDESLSLKFKWSLSNLEDEYLKSLSLQRQLPIQPKKPVFLNTNEILQPVKIDLNSHNSEPLNQASPKESLQSLEEVTSSNLNIDLSYFEQTEPENTSKNYLNQLLSEIYIQNGSEKDEDADKKCNY